MLNIVLFEPEIPANTGNIARTCVAFNCKLHLIRPYGFTLNDKTLKRAGIDYWKDLKYFEYDCFDDFLNKNKNFENNFYIITRHGKNNPDTIKINNDLNKSETFFIFGKESSGLPETIMNKYLSNSIRIPSINVRSMNLSNCVAIIAYHYSILNDFDSLDRKETIKKIYED